MSQQVIITRGLSGSGKSSWSKQWARENPNFRRICRDDLRFMMWDGDYSDEWEEAVVKTRDDLIWSALFDKHNVVLDEPFLLPKRIEELLLTLKDVAEAVGPLHIKIQDFIDVPVEDCIAHDAPRGKNRHVGEQFIRDYYERFVKPLLEDRGETEWII